MTLVNIEMWLPVYEDDKAPAKRYKLEKVFQAVPRKGEIVEITNGGWTEEVQEVWWLWDSTRVAIEFRPHVRDSCPSLFELTNRMDTPHAYMSEFDYEALAPAGWSKE